MRKAIKRISSAPEKFIPKLHLEDKDLDENNPDISKRPMVMYIRKLTRDEQFRIREMIEMKDVESPEKGILGAGDVARFVWENCVTEVRNVPIMEGSEVKWYESLTGKGKDDLWDTEGMDIEISEAIIFARTSSELSEAEAKNSP